MKKIIIYIDGDTARRLRELGTSSMTSPGVVAEAILREHSQGVCIVEDRAGRFHCQPVEEDRPGLSVLGVVGLAVGAMVFFSFVLGWGIYSRG